jgi:hypothetical protein
MRSVVVQSAQSCYLVMPIERVIAFIVRPHYKSMLTYIHTHMHSSWAHYPFNDDFNMKLVIKILDCDIQSRPKKKTFTNIIKFNNTRHKQLPQTRVKRIAGYNDEYQICVTQDFTIYSIQSIAVYNNQSIINNLVKNKRHG